MKILLNINNQPQPLTNLGYPLKRQSFCSKHKIMLGVAVSLAALASAAFYAYLLKNGYFDEKPKPGCVEGYYDDWTDSICENGEFISILNKGFPDRSRFLKLIEECVKGAQIPGCLHGKFYRELTQECKDNPAAALCDGKYDYQEFLKEAKINCKSPEIKNDY